MAVVETVAAKSVIQGYIEPEYEEVTEVVCTNTDPDPVTDPPDGGDDDQPPFRCIRREVIPRCDNEGYCWDEVIYLPCVFELTPPDEDDIIPPPP